MIFGEVVLSEAVGAILAHGVRQNDGLFKKGRILSAADVAVLTASGLTHVTVARLDEDDIPEDKAARALALAAAGQGTVAQQAFTGRANVHSQQYGLAMIDVDRVRAINHLHESLTIATLRPHAVVSHRQMLATVKIIPFATPRIVLEKALTIVGDQPLMHVRLFQRTHVSLVITRLPQTKASINLKSEQSIRQRLEALGTELRVVMTVEHDQQSVATAIAELSARCSDCILVFGASAIVDRGDVIPAALVEAGGAVVHLGMPVDPGNLLLLGRINAVPVIGVPSCARSPKRNGFDWVLERIMASIAVTGEDIMDMGAGGLLAEIPSRPSPRELASAPRVVAVVLAAGKSTRMGSHKMLAEVDGRPMLKVVVQNALESGVDEVIVVTGHGAADCAAVLSGLKVRLVHNPDYATGLSSSLRVGVEAAGKADAVVVCLGDMPRVAGQVIDRLIAAFNPTEHRSIVMPSYQGKIGNPVLWGAEHFPRLINLSGDKGARLLIAEIRNEATEVEADDEGVLLDVDCVADMKKITALDAG